jgi:hypothetical protein
MIIKHRENFILNKPFAACSLSEYCLGMLFVPHRKQAISPIAI